MPYLRYSRDKRGYENTYVLHTFRGKRGPEPRLLYWFRTPPGARVGRHPLDDEAVRAIEASNPGLEFDWGEMLKERPAPRPPENRRGRQRAARKKPPAASAPEREAASAEPAVPTARDPEAPAAAEAETHAPPETDATAFAEAEPEADVGRGRDEPWEHPVVALMGEEMLARLRALYTEVQAGIAERDVDAGTRDAALARAGALNPDGWETMEDAVHGIERFEAESDAIRALLDGPPAGSDAGGDEDDPPPGDADPADDDSA